MQQLAFHIVRDFTLIFRHLTTRVVRQLCNWQVHSQYKKRQAFLIWTSFPAKLSYKQRKMYIFYRLEGRVTFGNAPPTGWPVMQMPYIGRKSCQINPDKFQATDHRPWNYRALRHLKIRRSKEKQNWQTARTSCRLRERELGRPLAK